ncbi:MAG: hypothetical protein ACK4VO_08695 [Pseudobdellovibrio sp.]
MGAQKLILFVGTFLFLVFGAIGIGYLKTSNSQKTNSVDVLSASPIDQTLSVDKVLKGYDFEIELNDQPSDDMDDYGQIQNIEILLKDGRKIETYYAYNGDRSDLNNLFFKNAEFSLSKVFLDHQREILTVRSSEYLSRGEGLVASMSMFIILDDALYEIFQVLTQRDQTLPGEETNSLIGDVKIERGFENLPVIRYVYTLNGEKSEILFTWNGEKFVDTTGKYSEVESNFSR